MTFKNYKITYIIKYKVVLINNKILKEINGKNQEWRKISTYFVINMN